MSDEIARFPTRPLNVKAVTYPPPKQLFASSDKDGALTGALVRLAALTRTSVEPGVIVAYIENLSDLTHEHLQTAFEKAERNCRFFPTIGELREFANAGDAQSRVVEADEAWEWIQHFIAEFGVEGKQRCRPALSNAERQQCKQCSGVGFTISERRQALRCKCMAVVVTEPPEIPPRIKYALSQLAISTHAALEAVAQTESQHQPFLRKQFNEAYLRAGYALPPMKLAKDSTYRV